jgi:hypothetical protein
MKAAPYAGGFVRWFVAQLGGVGVLLVEFLLTVILAAAMYANGELATARLVRFGTVWRDRAVRTRSISPAKRFAALPSAWS